MIVADLLQQVVPDDGVRLGRGDGEIGRRHPVNEVALEHRGVAGDDRALLLGRETIGIRKRREQLLDRVLDVLLNGRRARECRRDTAVRERIFSVDGSPPEMTPGTNRAMCTQAVTTVTAVCGRGC